MTNNDLAPPFLRNPGWNLLHFKVSGSGPAIQYNIDGKT